MKAMSDDKKTALETPTVIFSTAADGSEVAVARLASDVAPKSSSRKKYVIIAISGVVAAAIILTAILVGMYLFTEAQKDIIKYSYNRDADTKEDVTSDPNSNIVQYHVNSPSYEMWVIDDFSKDIQVMKIHSADRGTNCYLAPLNRTIATDPSKVSAPTDQNTQNTNATYYLAYRAADTTVPDSSFLSKTARDACYGLSTYWVFPRCTNPDDPGTAQRQKRGWRCNWCGCGYCWSIVCAELTWCG